MIEPYDALLLVSFGGPEGPDDVLPFLENVTRGRGIPPERLTGVAEHYQQFGGISPINAQNRALLTALREDFSAHGLAHPLYWGNRNWAPYLSGTLRQMADDGVRRALVLVTAAYASYSGCRQYRENLAEALLPLGRDAPRLDKLRHFFNHPGFIAPMVDATVAALSHLPPRSAVAFVTHSIPAQMNATSGPDGGAYERQHLEVAGLVAAGVAAATGNEPPWRLVFCSRSGPPSQPWLEPDIGDHLKDLHAAGVPGVAIVPIGFVSDHMEVRHDLDTQALRLASSLELPALRVSTVGTDPRFVSAIRQLVEERAAVERGESPARVVIGSLGPSHDLCPPGCCPNLRGPRPAACGADVSSPV